jgi:hypothetical protein
MNERIHELAEQAGYKHPDAVGKCEDYAYFDHEKFAELIIRDCYVALHPMLRDMISRGQAYDMIQQHFGVEK